MAITSGLMSSLTDQWATPQVLFDELDAEFGFELDVCASEWNHKCANYFSELDDGLSKRWAVANLYVEDTAGKVA